MQRTALLWACALAVAAAHSPDDDDDYYYPHYHHARRVYGTGHYAAGTILLLILLFVLLGACWFAYSYNTVPNYYADPRNPYYRAYYGPGEPAPPEQRDAPFVAAELVPQHLRTLAQDRRAPKPLKQTAKPVKKSLMGMLTGSQTKSVSFMV